MAQAGFYHQPSVSGDDRAMCFTCNVCLVCWEKTDEPWSEHERHSPTCPFVKGEYTQNVPLAITYATDPAIQTTGFSIVSNGTQAHIVCTGELSGDIQLWKIKRQLKKVGSIRIRDDACQIMSTLNMENVNECEIRLHSMCTYRSELLSKVKGNCKGMKIVCGVTMNKEQFLVVYSVRKSKTKHADDGASGTTISNIDNLQEFDMELKNQMDTDDSAGKKSSLKNIIPEDQYDEEYIPLDTSASSIYDGWKDSEIGNNTGGASYGFKSQEDDDFNEPFPTTTTTSSSTFKEISKNIANNLASSSASSIHLSSATDSNGVCCKPIQSIPIIPILAGSYNITDIIPSYDNKYLLVVFRKSENTNDQERQSPQSSQMDVDGGVGCEPSPTLSDANEPNCVQLFVYQINENGYIYEQPISSRVLFEDHCPVQICMLPTYMNASASSSAADNNSNDSNINDVARSQIGAPSSVNPNSDIDNGVFAMVCHDGSLQLIALLSLRMISEISSVKGKFISVTYCKNLERLCVCTTDGLLHFYSFYDLDTESDEQEDEKMNFLASDTSLTGGENEISETDGSNQNSCLLDLPSTSTSPLQQETTTNIDAVDVSTPPGLKPIIELYALKNDLSINDLKTLYSLTLFDEMLTQYSAEVPACWNELVQAQKHRRHPHHLRPGDDTHLTKTWRLHNDAYVIHFYYFIFFYYANGLLLL